LCRQFNEILGYRIKQIKKEKHISETIDETKEAIEVSENAKIEVEKMTEK
jgi:hypothetical protein